MRDIKDGGSAFPLPPFKNEWGKYQPHTEGMTLRDYFAAKAMQGFMSSANFNDANFDGEAESAYLVADSMLKAREA